MIRYSKVFQLDGLSKWTMPAAFILKILVGLLLFWMHIQTYGLEELSHDGGTFLREGQHLNNVFFQSPKDYFKLLTGIGETPALIAKHLYMTEYWSSGDLPLINDSKNVIRLHSIVHFWRFDAYQRLQKCYSSAQHRAFFFRQFRFHSPFYFLFIFFDSFKKLFSCIQTVCSAN